MDASLASPVHLALYCLLRAQPAYTACAHTLAQALGQPFTEISPALAAMVRQGLLLQHADGPVTYYQLNTLALQALQDFLPRVRKAPSSRAGMNSTTA